MPISNVNVNTAATSAPAAQSTTSPNQTTPQKTSFSSKLLVAGLACLATYGVASVVKGKVIKHNSIKYCNEIAEEAPKLFNEAKNKANKLIADIQNNISAFNKDGYWILDKNNKPIWYKTLEEIGNSDVIYMQKEGKLSIITGLKEELDDNKNVVRRLFDYLFEINNDCKPVKIMQDGAYIPGTKDNPEMAIAKRVFDIDTNGEKLKSYGEEMIKKRQEKSYGKYTSFEKGKPIQVEFNTDHIQNKTQAGQIYKLNNKGKWKKQ